MKLTLQQLEAHLWGAANILRGKTAGQDYKNYILSLMFYKRLCDQWECEADDAIADLERQQRRTFSDKEKAVFRKRGEHRFIIPDGSRWGDVKTASTNIGELLTTAMRAVANANEELRGVFTVDWNQPAPDGSGKPLIPNEVVHTLIQHFDEHDLSNKSVPPVLLVWPMMANGSLTPLYSRTTSSPALPVRGDAAPPGPYEGARRPCDGAHQAGRIRRAFKKALPSNDLATSIVRYIDRDG
jgi:HsdM-like protein